MASLSRGAGRDPRGTFGILFAGGVYATAAKFTRPLLII
jgi:hypothetical protein